MKAIVYKDVRVEQVTDPVLQNGGDIIVKSLTPPSVASTCTIKKGDRVIVCGHCFFCKHEQYSQCDNSNPNGETGGLLGCSDALGGYAGRRNICACPTPMWVRRPCRRSWPMSKCCS